eukprot:3101101-Pyramimonas_sp.AAC.1
MHCEKLEILMLLHSRGWRPYADEQRAPYAIGESHEVLCRMPIDLGLPAIRHDMSQHYYRGLCTLRDQKKLLQLLAAVEGDDRPSDRVLAQLADADQANDDEDEGVLALEDVPPLPPLPPPVGGPGTDSIEDLR